MTIGNRILATRSVLMPCVMLIISENCSGLELSVGSDDGETAAGDQKTVETTQENRTEGLPAE